MLNYFSEDAPDYCGSCDVCMSEYERVDATIEAQKILSAISRLQERYGINYIVDFLRGSSTIRDDQQSLKTFGIGKDINKDQWKLYIKDLLQAGYLFQSEGEYPVLKLNEKSWKILKGEERVELVKSVKARKESIVEEKKEIPVYPVLLQQLKQTRDQLARKENVPAYLVFSDVTLRELASYLPMNVSDMSKISGFGNVKLGKYGEAFLKVVAAYCRENNLQTQIHLKNPKQLRSKPAYEGTSDTKQLTLTYFRQGNKPAEIAAMRQLALSTVESHLASFIRSNELDIHELVDRDKVEKILMELQLMDGNSIGPVKEKLGNDCSYGEIKAVMSYLMWMKEAGIEF